MDTSPSPSSSPNARIDLRDRLYYDRYEYCVDFRCHDAFCLKTPAHDLDSYRDMVSQKWQWRNAARLRTHGNRGVYNMGGSWHVLANASDTANHLMLQNMAELIWNATDIKPVFYYNWIYLYTNHADCTLQQLDDMSVSQPVALRRAVINRPRGTLLRQEPRFGQRSYLRHRRVTPEQKQALATFLLCQEDIAISPSFRTWFSDSYAWSHQHFYIDHDSDTVRLMIEMIIPGILGRSVRIMAINTV